MNDSVIIPEIDYQKIDKRVEQIIKKTIKYSSITDKEYIREEILKAYYFARDAHEGQFRLSWEPYISHPVAATKILLTLHPDLYTLQACLLHDVVEDTEKTLEDIKNVFGEEVAFLCGGMEKLSKVRYTWEDRNVGSLRKMFIAMAQDLRVVFIKVADRIHNMRTLKFHPKPHKRQRIALETLNIYAPIADRLGLFALKNELEEECFKMLHPKAYKKLKKELREMKETRESFMTHAETEIKNILNEDKNLVYKIDYRIKSMYSIYKKMQKKGLTHPQSLYDIFGIRIIVKNVEDCYRVLGMTHSHWTPLPQRFKDYIALPKPNGYKSLHTTVVGLLKKNQKQPAEIQIKTFEMMEYADIWVAAHYEYKENGSKVAQDISWVTELKDLTENLENNDFMTSLKIDVFNDRIFVFTPKWESVNLPSGSTAIDFAYHLHSDLWDHISIAKVNSGVYPLDKELNNGDIIEIIIDKNRKPNPFWLGFVKTSKARSRIRSFLKKEDKELHRERGRDVMNRYLEKSNLGVLDKEFSLLKIIDGRVMNVEERLQLLEQVGNFSITPSSLMRRILRSSRNYSNPPKKEKTETSLFEKEEESDEKKHIIVWWENDLDYTLCSCCDGEISSQIVGHINSKSIITIHNRKCSILKSVNKERLLPAYLQWEEHTFILADIMLVLKNRVGMLYKITQIVMEMWMNIEEIHSRKTESNETEVILIMKILEYDYLLVDRLIERFQLQLDENLISKTIRSMKW